MRKQDDLKRRLMKDEHGSDRVKWLISLSAGCLVACSSPMPRSASVIEEHSQNHRPIASVAATLPVTQSAPISAEDPVSKAKLRTVKTGETLYRIALEEGQHYAELMTWNKLQNPSDIQVGQVLQVSPPVGVSAAMGSPVKLSSVQGKSLEAAAIGTQASSVPATSASPPASTVVANGNAPGNIPPAVVASAEPQIEWQRPAEGMLLGEFDAAKTKGWDIAGKEGTPIFAAADGKVMHAGSGIRSYGNLVIVKHANGYISVYANNKSIVVKEGETVKKGQKIAEMGSVGTDRSKLHFEIRYQGKPIDPAKLLPVR